MIVLVAVPSRAVRGLKVMVDVLTDLEQATPEWLTEVLRRSGTLPSGHVVRAEQTPVNSSSQVAHLDLTYSTDAPPGTPQFLLLKIDSEELEAYMPQRNKREIAFYRLLAGEEHNLPVVRCYAAKYQSAEIDRFHLLLDDPSRTTHRAFEYSVAPPTMEQSEQIVDTLAEVQARCWETTRFTRVFAENHAKEVHTGEITDAFGPWVEETVARFLSEMEDRLTAQRRSLYQRIGRSLPPLLAAREASGRNLTLTQGDVHVGNFLYPRDSERDRPLIIDWKRVAVTIGARDLAYMMGLYWFPDTRAHRELPLLQRFHARLTAHGVTGYTWDDLWYDHRLSIMKQVFEALWSWSIGQHSLMWWNNLERITLAVEDLDAQELL